MNSKTFFLTLIIFGLVLSALILRKGDVLILAIPILSYLLVGAIRIPTDMSLSVSRNVDRKIVSAHEPVTMQVTIKNRGRSLPNVLFVDTPLDGMTTLEGSPRQRMSVNAGSIANLFYSFKAARGLYSWNTLQIIVSDPLGIWDTKKEIRAMGNIAVRSAVMQGISNELKPRKTLRISGPFSARKSGSGIDFWGVREYQPGDSLHRVNWRLTARYPRKLFTNEHEREEIADFGFILDARRLSNADEIENALFEKSVSALSSLSGSCLKNGNRVSLLVFGKPIMAVFPGSGKPQQNILARKLITAKLGANLALKKLEYFPARLFPTRSIIIVFSSVDLDDIETYSRLRAYGYEVVLISPDPVDFANSITPPSNTNPLAVRAAKVERVLLLKRLMKLGIKVVDWQVDKPLQAVLTKDVRKLFDRRNIRV